MQLIKSIEIKYFRSIYRLNVSSIGKLTVFSGVNDTGKSNILKSLNLFFNSEIERFNYVDFSQDFSFRRLNEVRLRSVKGKQFIRIDITFIRPPNYKASLPPTFTVTKIYLRDFSEQQTDNLESLSNKGKLPSSLKTARRALTQFLNRVRFEYVPAIRDREYFEYIVQNLQETLLASQVLKGGPILTAINDLNRGLSERVITLKDDFHKATGIDASIALPTDPNSLFSAFTVNTKWSSGLGESDIPEHLISLALRGDGIQAVYIPLLLKYMADNSSLFYIWGFEEPENSVEYNLAIDLANQFENIYSDKAQILVTTHSLLLPLYTEIILFLTVYIKRRIKHKLLSFIHQQMNWKCKNCRMILVYFSYKKNNTKNILSVLKN